MVLADALAPHGLVPVVTGRTVMVRAGAPAVMPASPRIPEPALPMGEAHNQPPAQAPEEYTPSYPRRNAVAARERMMQQAAGTMQQQEPASYDPETTRQPVSAGDDESVAMDDGMPIGAPMPLLAAEPPAAETPADGGHNYMQLTGLGDSQPRRLDQGEIRYWQAQPGESLQTILTNWSEQAGVQLFWAEGQDYQLSEPIQMHGTFPDAVAKVLEIFTASHPQPTGQLHPNDPNGPAVLIIDHRA
jgi:hypothetical protein